MRKVVAAVPSGDSVVVICDDGSAWLYVWRDGDWSEMKPVPETEYATRLLEEAMGL